MQSPQTRHRCAAFIAALALCPAHAETLDGMLERGPGHSVLWHVSPESGDLIGQLFANASQAGQVILSNCVPSLACVVEGARLSEPDRLPNTLRLAAQPSGWWLIEQVQQAYAQASLPMDEQQLKTRFGMLYIDGEHILRLNGSPVLDTPPPAPPPPQPAQPPTLRERLAAWWNGLLDRLRRQLAALRGQPLDAPAPPSTSAPLPPGTVELVQGNNRLSIAAHFELDGRDTVLLQDSGGTACPALYRFATLTPQGIAVTPAFGTCSDIATVTLEDGPSGQPEPRVAMTGSLGPSEPEDERRRAVMELHPFALRQGQVVKLAVTAPGQRS